MIENSYSYWEQRYKNIPNNNILSSIICNFVINHEDTYAQQTKKMLFFFDLCSLNRNFAHK